MNSLPWLPAPPLDAPARRAAREAMIFDHGKWDPQVGDTDVLCPTPLILRAEAWAELARLAETMDAEVRAAERAILGSPDALALLGLPRALRRALHHAPPDAAGPRVARFDFHATAEGWRVSEVNSDVPGGYLEAKGFCEVLAAHHPDCTPAGDPVAALVAAFLRALPRGGLIGLVHATAYTDDRQVMLYLARHLAAAGLETVPLAPDHVRWRAGRASLADDRALDALFRFFPAEWLPNLGWLSGWENFLRAGSTPHCNPPSAIVSQSKRFPLACARLGLRLPVWDALVPETRDPRALDRAEPADAWVLKPALGRVGAGIGLADATEPGELAKIRRAAHRQPSRWAAQRRFHATAWQTDEGPRFPCLGVYVVESHAAGIYGRVSPRPLIDAHAQDVAVLVAPPSRIHPPTTTSATLATA